MKACPLCNRIAVGTVDCDRSDCPMAQNRSDQSITEQSAKEVRIQEGRTGAADHVTQQAMDRVADGSRQITRLALFGGALIVVAALLGYAIYAAIGGGANKANAIAEATPSEASSDVALVEPSSSAPLPFALSCDAIKGTVQKLTHNADYRTARRNLIAAGWVPQIHTNSPVFEDGTEDFMTKPAWAAGYREVSSCAGTGMAPCVYKFADNEGNALEVVGFGEDFSNQTVDNATVICAGTSTSKASQNQLQRPRRPRSEPASSIRAGDVNITETRNGHSRIRAGDITIED